VHTAACLVLISKSSMKKICRVIGNQALVHTGSSTRRLIRFPVIVIAHGTECGISRVKRPVHCSEEREDRFLVRLIFCVSPLKIVQKSGLQQRNQTRWPKMRADELREVGTRARNKKWKSTHSQPVAASNLVYSYS
jgi:hypothetical protein